jgi:hypothetical protein
MPANKDFKRLVRGRMQKTGESYTAARANLLRTNAKRRQAGKMADASAVQPVSSAAPANLDYANLAGISDVVIKAKTGCTWERWVRALDHVEANTWPHREIARYIHEKYRTPSWWTQTVTVGYERIKGLRTIGQSRDGGFNANKSRTYGVPLPRLYRAFRDKRARAEWLPEIDLVVRTATRDKYLRITWPDGTSVDAGFLRKGPGKSQVAIAHRDFPDKAAAQRGKQFWAERLDALGSLLSTG